MLPHLTQPEGGGRGATSSGNFLSGLIMNVRHFITRFNGREGTEKFYSLSALCTHFWGQQAKLPKIPIGHRYKNWAWEGNENWSLRCKTDNNTKELYFIFYPIQVLIGIAFIFMITKMVFITFFLYIFDTFFVHLYWCGDISIYIDEYNHIERSRSSSWWSFSLCSLFDNFLPPPNFPIFPLQSQRIFKCHNEIMSKGKNLDSQNWKDAKRRRSDTQAIVIVRFCEGLPVGCIVFGYTSISLTNLGLLWESLSIVSVCLNILHCRYKYNDK